MKVALCLSGQPRWFLECSDFFKENIINNFDVVDVFIHMWFDGENYKSSISDLNTGIVKKDTIKIIKDVYKPIKIVSEQPKRFVNDANYPYTRSTTVPNNAYSMFYSIKRCIDLMNEHETSCEFEYDWVFRSRFDYAINRKFDPILLENLKTRTFYSPHVVNHSNPHCHADFNLGCSQTMKIYGRTFENLEKMGQRGITLATESMTYFQLVDHDIDIKELDLCNQFPPSRHSACWHSLWGHQ